MVVVEWWRENRYRKDEGQRVENGQVFWRPKFINYLHVVTFISAYQTTRFWQSRRGCTSTFQVQTPPILKHGILHVPVSRQFLFGKFICFYGALYSRIIYLFMTTMAPWHRRYLRIEVQTSLEYEMYVVRNAFTTQVRMSTDKKIIAQ